MRIKKIKMLTFDELSESAKQKAIDKHRYMDVEDYDWFEFVYQDFVAICEAIGVSIDKRRDGKEYDISFSGFYSQGSGSCFSASVDLLPMVKGIAQESWKEQAPGLKEEHNFMPAPCPVDARVLSLIERGWIDASVQFVGNERYYTMSVELCDWNWSSVACVKTPRIDAEMSKLEYWLDDTANELNSLLYKLLEAEYEYRTSDEAIMEALRINDMEFEAGEIEDEDEDEEETDEDETA